MTKHTTLTLFGAALALAVVGCRNDQRSSPPDEAGSPAAMPSSNEPPLIEDEDALGEDDDTDVEQDQHSRGPTHVPKGGEPETDPVDPDMPEAVDPGADPKQPPPPSKGTAGG